MTISAMEFLKPEIINIGGRRYRKPQLKTRNCNEGDVEPQYDTYYEDDMYDDEVESCNIEYCNIEKLDNGKFRERVKDIPIFYCRHIDGTNHEKKKEIESRTRTVIQLPRGRASGDIVITGEDRSGVIAARVKINTIIEMHRGEQSPGHFISISLVSAQVKENFEEFKRQVLQLKATGMDESLFQRPERLHLTITLLTFLNQAELMASTEELNSIVAELAKKHLHDGGDGILKMKLQGVEYMNDDPGEIDVLYAKVDTLDTSNHFQSFVDELVSTLVSAGYLKKQYDAVKLHATVINSLFRYDQSAQDNSGEKKKRITFDGKSILEQFSNYYFGELHIKSLDICIRKTFDADGLYKVATSLPLFQ